MSAKFEGKASTLTSWKSSTLKRFGALIGGSGFPLDEQGFSQAEMEIPFFKVKDLQSPLMLTETDNYISRETAARLGATVLPKSTIVFAKVGAALLLNRFRILGCEGCIDNNMMAFRLRLRHDVAFFRYCLDCVDFSRNFNQGPVPSINTRQVGSIIFNVPPLPEQTRIAAYLDASCAAIDGAVAAKRRQIEVLDGVRRDIVQRAVTRGIEDHPTSKQTGNVWMREVPSPWELVSLKRVSEIQTGLTLGKVYEGRLIERPYLRVANVQDGHLNLEEVTTIEVPEEVAHRVELLPGDVLMTEGGDLDKLGRGTIWSGEIPDCLHQNHIFAIRCFKHKLLPTFLAYLTASRYGRDYFEATGKRTTNLASTNSTKVGLFPIPRPSIAEQRAICRFLDEKLKQIAQIMNGTEAQITTLLAYRKSLIHECVTGQRRVKDEDVRRATSNDSIHSLEHRS